MPAIFRLKDPNLYNLPSGQAAIQLEGASKFLYCGDTTIDFEKSATQTDIRTPEDSNSPIVATDYSEVTGRLTITFRQLDQLQTALAYASPLKLFTQAAVAAGVQIAEGINVGDLIELRASDEPGAASLVDTIVTSIESGATAFVAGTHYIHDSKSGLIQIIALPDGVVAGDDLTVEYTAPAITVAANRQVAEILSDVALTGRMVVRQNNKRGKNYKFVYPKIRFGGGEGTVTLIAAAGTNEPVGIQVTGTLLVDSSEPPGRQLGYSIELV